MITLDVCCDQISDQVIKPIEAYGPLVDFGGRAAKKYIIFINIKFIMTKLI